MLSVLALVLLCLTSAMWASWRSRPATLGAAWDIRDALLIGAVVLGLWAALGAEVLSPLRALARTPVIVWWSVPVLAMSVWLFKHPWRATRDSFRPPRDGLTLALMVLGAILVVGTGLIALLTPPTTPDCLCYHMPRQVYWVQNRSVDFFPSGDLRQLEMPPLAEYLGAQLMLLSGTDAQANMIQWCAYGLGALAASLVVRDLGGGPRNQAFAALLTLLNPAAATQAVNQKNDLVVALWMLILLWLAVRVWTSRAVGRGDALLVGVTLGLFLLTKGTALVLGPPVCVVIGIGMLRAGVRRAIPLGAAIILVAGALNAPHWARNTHEFGSPLGLPAERGGFALGNETHSAAALASNLLRNITLHTNAPSGAINAWQERRVRGLHDRLGLDPSDDRTTSPHTIEYEVLPTWNSDGRGGAPVHLVLALAMLILARPGRLRARPAWPVFLIPYACALLFAYLLKWQPWHARLHIPIVAAAAPMIAVWLHRRSALMVVASIAAAIPALMAVAWNLNKPLLGPRSIVEKTREEVRFQVHPQALEGARRAIDRLAELKPGTLSLQIQPGTCEYSLMRLILDRVEPRPRLEVFQRKFGPEPASRAVPAAVLVYQPGVPSPNFHMPSDAQFACVWNDGIFYVYVPR